MARKLISFQFVCPHFCDFCDKAFNKHRDFTHGVFSVGCACAANITYGYELMLCRESSHNIFRLLMCRDINLLELRGVIFDHANGLDQYLLNREPREFEYLRCLVDGAHWQVIHTIPQTRCSLCNFIFQGQKKLKKPDSSGKAGISDAPRVLTLTYTSPSYPALIPTPRVVNKCTPS